MEVAAASDHLDALLARRDLYSQMAIAGFQSSRLHAAVGRERYIRVEAGERDVLHVELRTLEHDPIDLDIGAFARIGLEPARHARQRLLRCAQAIELQLADLLLVAECRAQAHIGHHLGNLHVLRVTHSDIVQAQMETGQQRGVDRTHTHRFADGLGG